MEEKKFSLKGVIQKLKEYVDNYKDLAYLKFVGKISKLSSGLLVGSIILLFALFVVFFMSMALALFIGELLNSYALGFAITGLLFIVFILLIVTFMGTVKKKFTNAFVRMLVKLRNDDNDDE